MPSHSTHSSTTFLDVFLGIKQREMQSRHRFKPCLMKRQAGLRHSGFCPLSFLHPVTSDFLNGFLPQPSHKRTNTQSSKTIPNIFSSLVTLYTVDATRCVIYNLLKTIFVGEMVIQMTALRMKYFLCIFTSLGCLLSELG